MLRAVRREHWEIEHEHKNLKEYEVNNTLVEEEEEAEAEEMKPLL
jgi:hypothetical protein